MSLRFSDTKIGDCVSFDVRMIQRVSDISKDFS